jgi:hypothetical protein
MSGFAVDGAGSFWRAFCADTWASNPDAAPTPSNASPALRMTLRRFTCPIFGDLHERAGADAQSSDWHSTAAAVPLPPMLRTPIRNLQMSDEFHTPCAPHPVTPPQAWSLTQLRPCLRCGSALPHPGGRRAPAARRAIPARFSDREATLASETNSRNALNDLLVRISLAADRLKRSYL